MDGKVNTETRRPLQDDRWIRRPALMAGVVVELLLIGLFVTTLFRAPNPAWSGWTAAFAIGLPIAMYVRHRRRLRRTGDSPT
ncbi:MULTISPECIES: hypothetical protein [unclassified Pseudonocardia]|jgi:hypothetical protein|uniref:hypothetical protein n=1 Tax=unclassified Pseudonocardia TaxID=2619320 RepID=UPI001AC76880|nr:MULTISPECIES: hypothetical protein [unclassified Pseudonocardia]MBN9096640.1 hypothetical protein [Pseudonocardia sp.]